MGHPTKRFLTTKHTKATKVSDIDILKLLNFVLFVTFFENTRLGMRTNGPPGFRHTRESGYPG
jgi:hypothetical protein